MLRPRTKLEWAFFSTTASQAIIITALQFTVLVRYLDWVNDVVYQVPLAYIFPVSIAVSVAGCIYQAILTLDAFRIKNNIQLFAQCICNICLSIASAMQYAQLKHAAYRVSTGYASFPPENFAKDRPFWSQTKPILIVCVVVTFACTVAICFLAYKLHQEFAWALYKDISADINTRSRYLAYQMYLVLIKLTFYFVFSFIIIYAFINVHYIQPEFSLTLAVIPVSLLQVGLAVYYTRTEAKVGMGVTIIIYLCAIAYLISRVVVLCNPKDIRAATTLKDEQLLFVFVAIIFLFAAVFAAVQCMLNFDKGLKPILLGQTQRKGPAPHADDEENVYYFQRLNYAPNTVELNKRFELD